MAYLNKHGYYFEHYTSSWVCLNTSVEKPSFYRRDILEKLQHYPKF